MRGAWGKPYGKVARVNIGQPLISIRCKDAHKPVIMEALRRARYKFPGRQKIIISKKWGFTPLRREEYEALRAEKKVIEDGCYVQFLRNKGPLLENLQVRDPALLPVLAQLADFPFFALLSLQTSLRA